MKQPIKESNWLVFGMRKRVVVCRMRISIENSNILMLS